MSAAALSPSRAHLSGFWSTLDSVADLSAWRRRSGWFIGTVTVAHLLIIATTGLSDTESYYYIWSRFPALSYYDHPPLVAWMAAVTTLVSKSAFSARVGAVVCSALLGALVYRLAARMFSPRAGFLALVAVTTPPVLFFTGFLLNPESPLAPLWVLSLLLLDDLRDHDEPWRPLLLGLTVGAAFLAKYTALLLVPVALVFLGTSVRTRRWLRRPSLYASGLVALAVASPVVIWNYKHHWPSVTLHLVERMSAPTSFALGRHALQMGIDQFVLYQPLAFPGLLAMLWIAVVRARKDERYRLLAVASAPVLLFLFAVMVKASDAEPHWTMVGFLPLAIAAGGWLDEHLDSASRGLVRYLRACVGVSAAFFVVYFLHTQSPIVMRWIPAPLYSATVDPINETFGWEGIRNAILDEAAQLGPNTVVASSHNVVCGQVAARIGDRPHVYCPSPRRTEFDFVGRRDPPSEAPVVYVDSARYHESVSDRLPGRACVHKQTVAVMRDARALNNYGIYACRPVQAGELSLAGP